MIAKFFQFVGAVFYAVISAYLVWIVFYWVTPWLMGFGWIALILYWIFAFGLIAWTLKFISFLITYPLFMMVGNNKSAGVVASLVYLCVGGWTILLPWMQAGPYTLVRIIIGVSLSLTAFSIFAMTLNLIWRSSARPAYFR